MREAVIVSSVRTAVGKAGKGALKDFRPDDMAAAAIKGALARVPALPPDSVEDVILGCAMPEAEQGMNVGRIGALLAGLPSSVPGMTINRFCSSGLQAIALAVDAVVAGRAEVVVAGGTESMSLIPMGGHKIAPNPSLLEHYPDAYLGMGMTAELVARKYGIDREKSDAFALASHQKALAAIAAGADGLIVEVHPRPEEALSDGQQSLTPPVFEELMAALTPVAEAVGRVLL
jgi:acetyl-CoA acyltransferase